MPAPVAEPQVYGRIGFTLPNGKVDHSPEWYTQSPAHSRPIEQHRVPLRDLRPEVDNGLSLSAVEQLDRRGFALVDRPSAEVSGAADSAAGNAAYVEECRQYFAELFGGEAFVWNSVMRSAQRPADPTDVKDKTQQKARDADFVPASNLQPTAGCAHVDQDEANGRRIAMACTGEDDLFETCSRVQIVNLWRPLAGPVTNHPLAFMDFRSIDRRDMAVHKAHFGTAYDVHHNPSQSWHYLSRQMPSEAVLLRCYDSNQGAGGEALYAAHVGVDELEGEPPVEGEMVPRSSIEVRLVVVNRK